MTDGLIEAHTREDVVDAVLQDARASRTSDTAPAGDPALAGLDAVGEQGWSALDHLARSLRARPDLDATLDAILRVALDALPQFGAAGVNLFARGRFEPQRVLGAAPHRLDEEQKRTGDGPCIAASRDQQQIVVDDMATDRRWPGFAELAVALGVRAMVCVPLWVDESRLGSVSLYADGPVTIDRQTSAVAGLLATHAAIAIAAARKTDNLAVGMAGRDVIGQAKGVLMERYRITADEAFELLRQSSMATQLKVQEVAYRLVTTGEVAVPR